MRLRHVFIFHTLLATRLVVLRVYVQRLAKADVIQMVFHVPRS